MLGFSPNRDISTVNKLSTHPFLQMENEYDTMVLDDTVIPESPIVESRFLNLDTNTEVLSVCESAQHLEDQMGDNYCLKEIVLDSDDERGVQDESVASANGLRNGRLFSRGDTSLRKRQKVRAGCFRKLDKRVRRHAFFHTDSARSDWCNEGSNAGSTCPYSDSIFREHIGVMDSVLSTTPDQKPIATDAKEFLDDRNIIKECLVDESLDEGKLSSRDCKFINGGKEADPLNYDESQEAAESHSKALGFVDRFLSVSDIGWFENVDFGKTNRISSPPSLRSKGSQCLARRVSLAHYANKSMAFDWVEKHIEDDEYTTLRMKEDKIFGFEGDKSECLPSIEESSDVNFQKRRISSVHSEDKLLGSSNDLVTKSLNTNDTGKIGLNSGTLSAHDSIDAGLLRQKVNEGEDLSLTLEALDIGMDTQIAAEAMEELFNAAPPRIDPCLTHQSSYDTVLDYTVHKGSKLKNAVNHEEAFVGWGCKEKRSRCVKIFAVRDKTAHCFAVKQFELPLSLNKKMMVVKDFNSKNPGNSRNSNQKLACLGGLRSKETTDRSKSGFPTIQRKTTDVSRDVSREVVNINLDVADATLSNPMWSFPKRKRSRPHTVSPPGKLSNRYPPCAETENNVERTYPVANDEKNKRLSNLLVYNRRRKVSLEGEQVESPSEKLVQSPGDIGTANPSREYGTLNGGELSSFDSSNHIKSNVLLSNGHSSPLQVSDSSEMSKQSFNYLSRSPLTKELMRLGCTESLPDFLPKDSRRRKRAVKNICILFSQNLEASLLKQQRKIVARLGFSIVSCCSEATHFVTNRFVRTRNMLEAIALGKQVVTHLWLESCEQAGCVIDEKSYILRDGKKEKEIGFNMLASLSRASHHPLLQGRRVLITPNVRPDVDAINSLAKAAGAKVVQIIQNPKPMDQLASYDLLILSCKEDYTICFPFLAEGASVYDSELLLNGIVTQRLEYERYQLFKDLA